MDGKTHLKVGQVAGAAAALVFSKPDDTFWDVLLQAIGGYVGGTLGQAIPDFLEPAVHSYHRDVAHSIAAGLTVVEITRRVIETWGAYCREKAKDAADMRATTTLSDGEHLACSAEEAFWKMAVGFGPGVAAGYVSHLALDATTPRGIPFVTRGL